MAAGLNEALAFKGTMVIEMSATERDMGFLQAVVLPQLTAAGVVAWGVCGRSCGYRSATCAVPTCSSLLPTGLHYQVYFGAKRTKAGSPESVFCKIYAS
jgi:hypothetical protein